MRRFAAASPRGFTLVELLVVVSILAILAGILFPVFASVKREALRTSCLANFRSATTAATLYMGDYDDRFMPINSLPGTSPDPAVDRVWPEYVATYAGHGLGIFSCPAEPNATAFGGTFDPDLTPGDYGARYYETAMRSDLGYNAYYLAPIVRRGDAWVASPKALSELSDPARTPLFVESRAEGGGSYLVAPPCRYIADHNVWMDTFLANAVRDPSTPDPVFTPIVGWDVSGRQSAYPNGGVGVRHGNRLNLSRLDGSARSVTLDALKRGCQVRTGWQGSVTDPSAYAWYPVG